MILSTIVKKLCLTIGMIIISLFTHCMALGKCPYRDYEIKGVVQEERTNQFIADAKLLFFFDDEQSTLTNGFETKYPDYFITDAQGAFTATVYFYTYSGWFLNDRCNKKPESLTVIITVEGYPARRMEFKLKKLIDPDGVIILPIRESKH
jgi:hypothetical protein